MLATKVIAKKFRTEFVLVSNPDEKDEDHNDKTLKRSIFIQNLQKRGLKVKTKRDSNLVFDLIYAPKQVLERYAEILKIKMPLKASYCDAVRLSEAEDDENFKLFEKQAKEKSLSCLSSCLSMCFGESSAIVRKFRKIFMSNLGEIEDVYYATYSREQADMFDPTHETFFNQSKRLRIIEFLLKRQRFSEDAKDEFAFGIDKLIQKGVYSDAYPIHDRSLDERDSGRSKLSKVWGSFGQWYKYQPLDAIRKYFGVKIGLYFAWLGFFTSMLIFPSIAGLVVFIYGLVYMGDDIPSYDTCEGDMKDEIMCPICDPCEFWRLKEACDMTKYKGLFDNNLTVAFSIFMSLWAVFFLELWTRYQAELTHRWGVYQYDPEEEHPRPEYLAQLETVDNKTINFVTKTTEPKPPFWKMKVPRFLFSWTVLAVLVVIALISVVGVILYRMSMVVALSAIDDATFKDFSSLTISITGAAINLIIILILNVIYDKIAIWLTNKELHRTQTDYDNALTLKSYLFQFVNFYSSIFYIAFFKGRFTGTPDDYERFLGYRQEECAPGGCFMELTVQMAMIFVGKQFLAQIMEYYMPLIWKGLNLMKIDKLGELNDSPKKFNEPQYVQDFKMAPTNSNLLFNEYLEIIIQFGFITIFVCAFPLAPLLALINNILEIRLDAKKLLIRYRRPIPQNVKDIGIWFDIMRTLNYIAVITNAFIIALTSDFIPQTVYRYVYSPNNTLVGYVNFTLSYVDTQDLDRGHINLPVNASGPQICRYSGFRNPPWSDEKYEHSLPFYHIWFIRLLFVVCFQTGVGLCLILVRYLVPNVPADLKERIRRETFIVNELMIRKEDLLAHHDDDGDESENAEVDVDDKDVDTIIDEITIV